MSRGTTSRPGVRGHGRLVLVRHGESEWNVTRRIQGQSGTGLSERGRAQARRTADILCSVYPDALIASSDLERCRATVEPLTQACGRPARFLEGLRERDFGQWTGRLAEEVRAEHAELWRRWSHGQDVVAEIGGESTPQLVERVVGAVDQLFDDVDGGVVICVTHGGPVWHGTHALLGLERGTLGGVANCSVTEIDLASGDAWLISWNQVTHLPADLRQLGAGPDRGTAGDEEHEPPSRGEETAGGGVQDRSE